MGSQFNIVDLFYQTSLRIPKKTALIYRAKKITFDSFSESVTKTALYFLKKGIQKGDRVMVFVPMSDHLYRIVLALFRIGAVAVFLDEWVNVKRLNECCKLADCKAFIGTPKGTILAWFVPGLRKIPLHFGLHYDKKARAIKFPETSKNDIALITFTTGSTGIPKAAIRTHELLFEQFQALIPLIKPGENDISMPVLPIVLLLNLGAGVTSVIADYISSKPSSLNPEKIFSQISKYGVNTIIASPSFVKELAQYLLNNQSELHGIDKIFTGGAPVFPSEANIYQRAFPETDIRIVFGSTEAEPISSVEVEELITKINNLWFQGLFVGKPEKCTTVKIIGITDENISVSSLTDLENLEVKAGETGEIIVSGKHVLSKYLNNPAALNRNKIFVEKQCWHRTGDSGYLDTEGSLFLTGRCNSLIETGGKNISSFVYENHFQTINGVEAGTVMIWKNKVTAVIELSDFSLKDSVKSAIQLTLDTLEDIIFVDKMPRDPRHNSKIDYEKLKVLVQKLQ
ncbi:AMP-binding protein [Dyadobacter psychrotolerans]|uniref:AMP-dependent synthetase n=1 Tax=Dyadobacter psychrotolerans TaxID=2541721 RepID=A0A4R5DUY3_9BACT|nr:AMP-binding protein [Dyadobacter psychrotolerans]TDE16324.1 AMP-dependent synthetase [Dyadobacter psychrotolerans]